ncbi:MAG: GNAT family N-acetyltransferase [Candidatus Berkelbacteria bacterium]|nr:GNAT family N-acetyltransferase [Candidatus Berkelbacteria bacterium]
MKYKVIKISEAKIIAGLHKQNIVGGFLSSLDIKTLEKIYSSILSEKQNFGFIAIKDNTPVGFILTTENCNNLYKKFIRNHIGFGVRIFFSKLLSPTTMKKIVDHVFYPGKRKELPKAEILSIAINKKYRRLGIAKKLATLTIKELKSRKIKNFIAIVGQKLTASNYLMRTIGGEKLAEIEIHRGGKSNVYIWKL